jgi:hypothetical protein
MVNALAAFKVELERAVGDGQKAEFNLERQETV